MEGRVLQPWKSSDPGLVTLEHHGPAPKRTIFNDGQYASVPPWIPSAHDRAGFERLVTSQKQVDKSLRDMQP